MNLHLTRSCIQKRIIGCSTKYYAGWRENYLFSSHITTDLDRIADYITFIQNGKHIFTKDIYAIAEDYVLVKGPLDLLKFDTEREFISVRKANTGFEGLIENAHSIENLFDKDVVIENQV